MLFLDGSVDRHIFKSHVQSLQCSSISTNISFSALNIWPEIIVTEYNRKNTHLALCIFKPVLEAQFYFCANKCEHQTLVLRNYNF